MISDAKISRQTVNHLKFHGKSIHCREFMKCMTGDLLTATGEIELGGFCSVSELLGYCDGSLVSVETMHYVLFLYISFDCSSSACSAGHADQMLILARA
jgi:hypothetical protein